MWRINANENLYPFTSWQWTDEQPETWIALKSPNTATRWRDLAYEVTEFDQTPAINDMHAEQFGTLMYWMAEVQNESHNEQLFNSVRWHIGRFLLSPADIQKGPQDSSEREYWRQWLALLGMPNYSKDGYKYASLDGPQIWAIRHQVQVMYFFCNYALSDGRKLLSA